MFFSSSGFTETETDDIKDIESEQIYKLREAAERTKIKLYQLRVDILL